MGMNPRGRSRGRNHNFNNNRRFNNAPSRNTVYDSLGPVGRIRGTAFQLMEKYQAAAKDSMSSDRVLAENCLQHADHYMRLNAMAMAAEQRNNPQQYVQSQSAQSNVADGVNQAETTEQSDAVEEMAVEMAEASAEDSTSHDEPEFVHTPDMDLSIPISAMVENEKKRREKPAPVDVVASVAPVAVAAKRRGRPPRAKAVVSA